MPQGGLTQGATDAQGRDSHMAAMPSRVAMPMFLDFTLWYTTIASSLNRVLLCALGLASPQAFVDAC